jgi:predicted metalloprotease with PDZ domain
LETDGSGEAAGMALGRLVVVLDGARRAELKIKLKRFRVETAVSAVSAGTHYVRFHIDSNNRGRIVCNPIFISVAPDD